MFAKILEVKPGTKAMLDNGFTCAKEGPVIIEQDEDGLFFRCSSGKHYIDGQIEGDEYTGLTIPT